MSTVTLKGVQIFARGRWNANTFSSADLDSIVESFNTLGLSGKVPLKLGHEGPDGRLVTGERNKKGQLKDPMSQLAMGWVTKIYRKDDVILADVEVPEKVHQLIEDKYLKFVSAELFQEVRTSRKVFPWVLDAVALLGTDPPAVGILSEITSLSAHMHAGLQQGALAVVFARADKEIVSTFTIGEPNRMAGEITLESLSEKLLAMSAQISTVTEENQKLKVQLAEAGIVTKNFKSLQEKVRATEVDTHRTMIKNLLENAVKEENILPSARERFLKIFKVDDEDGDTVMDVSAEDVKDYIKDNPNPKAKTKVRKFAAVKSPTDDLPDGIAPDAGMVLLMEAQLRQDGVKNPSDRDIEAAVLRSFKANPAAAEAYQTQQNDIELGRSAAR